MPLNLVYISKIIVSNRWKINDISSKCFIGYLNQDVIKPLCIILPQMNGFIKFFENNYKNMLKFDSNPIHDKKYIITKLKIFNDVNKTTFTDDMIPKEKNSYVCIAVIDIDSVLKIDKKSISTNLFRTVQT